MIQKKENIYLSKIVSMDELVPIMEESLERGGKVTFTPKGTSMLPMLRSNVDTVTLEKPVLPLKKYDLPLYVRDNGMYVLHRVVKVEKDGYVMRGDNQLINERGITDEQIIGLVTDFSRKGKQYSVKCFSYRIYSVLWINTLTFKKVYFKVRRMLGKIKHKLMGKS